MNTHVNKCKNDKIKKKTFKIPNSEVDNTNIYCDNVKGL
jgi:hypothetical protein